jgi:hypothetical protein
MKGVCDIARSRLSAVRNSYRFAVTEWDQGPKSDKSRPRSQVIAGNILYAVIRGDICDHYFLGDCDKKNVSLSISTLSNREWMSIHRAVIKSRGAEKTAEVIANKTMLASLLSNSGIRVAESVGDVVSGKVRSLDGKVVGIEDVFDIAGASQLFLKPAAGRGGRGSIILSLLNERVSNNGNPFDLSRFDRGELDGYIIQQVIVQHYDLARYHEPSLNTLRIVTLNDGGNIQVIGCFLRVGVGGSHVDSWSAGGLAIRVCTQTGVAAPFGVAKNSYPRFFRNHPDSGISFGELKIPHLTRAFKLACDSHRRVGSIATVGWDIAIDDDGPIVVEGNTLWGVLFFKVFDPEVLTRYYPMLKTRN